MKRNKKLKNIEKNIITGKIISNSIINGNTYKNYTKITG